MKGATTVLGGVALAAMVLLRSSAAEVAPASSDPLLVEYDVPVPGSRPLNIVAESPGHVWFTMPDANMIGSLVVTSTIEYQFITYTVPTTSSMPYDLALGEEAIWFTERAGNKIGRLDLSDRTITEYVVPTPDSAPTGIDVAPNGAVWFTERDGNRLGVVYPATGVITDVYEYSAPDGQLQDIKVQNGNHIWFTAPGLDRLVIFDPERWPGTRAFYDIPAPGAQPSGLAVADDGFPWITAPGTNRLGRFTPSTMSYWAWFSIPTPSSCPTGIAVSVMDGTHRTWFVETAAGKVGQLVISLSGSRVHLWEYSLPSASSQPWGISVDSEGHAWITESGSNKIAVWRPPFLRFSYLPTILRQ